MEKFEPKIINEIAQYLDCGLVCYFNPQTEEIVTFPDFVEEIFEDEIAEEDQADLGRVTESGSGFIKIEPVETFESFKIMERFVAQIPDTELQFQLENILQRNKPFGNFKHAVNHSKFREEWFEFKIKQLEILVIHRINSYF